MEKLKWFALGFITACAGLFLIHKYTNKDSNTDDFMNGFNAIKSPNAPKEYGEIAQNIQQKQAQNYAKIDAEYKKGLTQ